MADTVLSCVLYKDQDGRVAIGSPDEVKGESFPMQLTLPSTTIGYIMFPRVPDVDDVALLRAIATKLKKPTGWTSASWIKVSGGSLRAFKVTEAKPEDPEEKFHREAHEAEQSKLIAGLKKTMDATVKAVVAEIKGKVKPVGHVKDPDLYSVMMPGFEGDPDLTFVIQGKFKGHDVSVALIGYIGSLLGSHQDHTIGFGLYDGSEPSRQNNIERDQADKSPKKTAQWLREMLADAYQ